MAHNDLLELLYKWRLRLADGQRSGAVRKGSRVMSAAGGDCCLRPNPGDAFWPIPGSPGLLW